MNHLLASASLAILLSTTVVLAGPTCPNEFETPDTRLNPLFAYFGGVTGWGTVHSTTTIHSGYSCEVWATLVNDQFSVAGFAVGTFGISPPALNVPASADTFSVTIQSPTNGQLSVSVTLREDDNNDGVINVNEDDDQWESPTIMLLPGTNVYNIPASQFQDSDADVGNNQPNFTTTGRLAYMLVFESRDSYPGGQVVGSVSLRVDHCGLYIGAQTLPPQGVPGDIDGDGEVDVNDLLAQLSAWGACDGCPADLDGNGFVNVTDLLELLAHWS
jgi:hypothetical protein